jgi:putative PIN family toxin of toxin-antitoxin system
LKENFEAFKRLKISDDLLGEILTNLRLKIKLPDNLINSIGKLLREHARFSTPVSLAADVCRDPDDIKVLGLAVASNADYIITGDKDLLILKGFQNFQPTSSKAYQLTRSPAQ